MKNDSGDFQVEVVLLTEMRGPAAVAQTLYRETEASRELRRQLAEERKAMPQFDGRGEADHRNGIAVNSISFGVKGDR